MSPGLVQRAAAGLESKRLAGHRGALPPPPARVPPRDWHLLGDLSPRAGAVQLLTSRWTGSSDLETSKRKVGSKGPDSKPARAHSGTFTDTRCLAPDAF